MVLSQIITWVYKDTQIPTKYQHLTGMYNFDTGHVGSLEPLLTLCIGTMHSPIYHSKTFTSFYNEHFNFFDTNRVCVYENILFLIPFRSIWYARTFIPRCQYGLEWYWPQYPNNNSSIQRFSDLDIPNKYQISTGITILMPTGRFFNTIIVVDYWYHPSTYIPDRHWLLPGGNVIAQRGPESWDQQHPLLQHPEPDVLSKDNFH